MDNDKPFLRRAKSVSYLNTLRLKERLGVGHFLLLTEIVASKIKGKSLPNVKWLQTEPYQLNHLIRFEIQNQY